MRDSGTWLARIATGHWLAISVLFGPAGCTLYDSADSRRGVLAAEHPVQLVAGDWPERNTDALPALVEHTPKSISWWKPDPNADPVAAEVVARMQRPEVLIAYTGVHGVGVIRVLEEPPQDDRPTARPGEGPSITARGRAFSPMRFVSLSKNAGRPEDVRIKRLRRWLQQRARNTPQPGTSMNDPEVLAMLWEGTGVRVIPPKPDVPSAGTVVHMPGLGSLEYEQPVLDELGARGWWVVRIATPRVWWLEDRPFNINSASDVEPVAIQIAALVDDLLAEPAYAAEASLDYLRQERREIRQRPLVLLGMSAGALMMPAVAARLGERVDGIVLVGAGANLLHISQESELTDGGLKIHWGPNVNRNELLPRLYEKYLQTSKLDPYTTGAAVREIPTLLILASMDGIVPSTSGRLLWERMGRPERYRTPFGHALLFWQLSQHTSRIANWIDRVAATSRKSADLTSGDALHSTPAPQPVPPFDQSRGD